MKTKVEMQEQQAEDIDTNQEERDIFQNTGFKKFYKYKCLLFNCISLFVLSLNFDSNTTGLLKKNF
jgi:hypothetical protein